MFTTQWYIRKCCRLKLKKWKTFCITYVKLVFPFSSYKRGRMSLKGSCEIQNSYYPPPNLVKIGQELIDLPLFKYWKWVDFLCFQYLMSSLGFCDLDLSPAQALNASQQIQRGQPTWYLLSLFGLFLFLNRCKISPVTNIILMNQSNRVLVRGEELIVFMRVAAYGLLLKFWLNF